MLTSCVLDKLLLFSSCCSFPNFSWPRNLESFIYWGVFYDLGSGWLKMERRDLCFWFSCVNEWTQTFSYLNNIWKVFFHLLGVLSWYWWVPTSFRVSWHCLGFSLLPLDGYSLQALEVHKWVTEIFCLSSLSSKASGLVPLTTSVCWKANYSSPHFHL